VIEKTMKDLVQEEVILVPFKQHEIVEVTLTGKSKNALLVDVLGIAEGMIPVKEWGEEGSNLKIGEKILAYVMLMENDKNQVVLSLRRADQQRFNVSLNQKYKNKDKLTIKVVEANKGGLLCEIGTVRGFLPVSQLSYEHYPRVSGDKGKILARLKELINENLLVKIIAFDNKTNNPIFSEKAAAENVPFNIKKDDVLEGTVSGVTDFGIFVNLGTFDGLVHISEASWSHVDDLSKIAKPGDKIRVKVIGIESGRVFLSLKRLQKDPYLATIAKYKEGDELKGEVTKIVPFGAFVKIKDIEGLVKSADLEKKKIEEGKKYNFKIAKIDKKSRRINLTLAEKKKKKPA